MAHLTLTAIYDRLHASDDAKCAHHPHRRAEWVQRLDDGDRPLCVDCLPEDLRDRCRRDR